MSSGIGDPFEGMAAAAAVGTLPIGILAGLFLGVTWGIAVFVIGWLLLVPVFGVLSDRRGGVDREEVPRRTTVAERTEPLGDRERSNGRDPLETLRERYASGELSDSEFEERLERLVATEELPPGVLKESDREPTVADTEPDRESDATTDGKRVREQ